MLVNCYNTDFLPEAEHSDPKIIHNSNLTFTQKKLTSMGVPMFLRIYSWIKSMEPEPQTGTSATCLMEQDTNLPYPLKSIRNVGFSLMFNIYLQYQQILLTVSWVSSNVSVELSLMVLVTSLMMLLYSEAHANSLRAISRKQLEWLKKSVKQALIK